jgi:hypothetical protein
MVDSNDCEGNIYIFILFNLNEKKKKKLFFLNIKKIVHK